MNKQLILDAFNLSKRVPHVFLLGIIVSLITRIPVIGYVGSIIYSGLILALPTFLKDAQEDKQFNVKASVLSLWLVIRRSFFPLIICGIILVILLFIIYLSSLRIFGSSVVQFISNPRNLTSWNISSILFVLFSVLIFSPFSMIPIYYTIKLESFRKSILKSIIFNIKNPKFYIALLLFEFTNAIFNKLLFTYSDFKIVFILQLVYLQIVLVFTSALCLLYFQKSEK